MKRRPFVWTALLVATHLTLTAAAPQRVVMAGINNF
jgi:hypothetical protein